MQYIWRWRSEVQTKVLFFFFFLEGTIFQEKCKFLKVIESIVMNFSALGKKRSQWVNTYPNKLFTFKQFKTCSNSCAKKKNYKHPQVIM